jgi:hypothetical protein
VEIVAGIGGVVEALVGIEVVDEAEAMAGVEVDLGEDETRKIQE